MKNDKTGLGGRMDDFEFVIVKKAEPKKETKGKDEKRLPNSD